MFDASFIEDLDEGAPPSAAGVTSPSPRLARYVRNDREIHRTLVRRFSGPEAMFDAYIDVGRRVLGLPTGAVRQIIDDRTTVLGLSTERDDVALGDIAELAATYCSEVLRGGRCVAHTRVSAAPEGREHPCFVATGVETYIGAPIRVGGRIFGTLHFTSPEPREEGFTAREQEQIELLADAMGRSLEVIAWQAQASA